ncbi:hypothetical protein BBJ28_00022084 [Nothophytophthora sp. Chile5]|nr:hypothetical protein BBJ28_00022084 [Nothophytophthora sp. Chile5]
MSAGRMGFEGPVWLLKEKKSTFYAAQWRQEDAVLRSEALPFWPRLQVVLHVEGRELLVLGAYPGDASERSGDSKDTKKLVRLEVRPMEDVRRAQLYQTAARTQTLELYLDVEFTRERFLSFIQDPERVFTGPHAASSASASASSAAASGKQLIERAFAALERAQQTREQGGDPAGALQLYREAERGFQAAERVVADDRSRQLLHARREDLQRSIRSLEAPFSRVGAATAPANGDACDRSGADLVTPAAADAAAAAALQPEMATPEPDIRARLEELRRFAMAQDVNRAQREHRTAPSDLSMRLAALRNERTGPAPPMDALTERLRRLRGDNAGESAAVDDKQGARKSAVDRVIEQVTDEIALGIDDEEVEEEEDQGDSEGSSSSSSSSKSSSEDSEERAPRR